MTIVSEKSEKSVEKKTATSTGATVINYKGVHHLGGIFCNVVDVKSEEEAHEELLTTVAWNQFGSEVSVGVQGPLIGGAISGSVKISSSKGKTFFFLLRCLVKLLRLMVPHGISLTEAIWQPKCQFGN